jgi:hypothetical protein
MLFRLTIFKKNSPVHVFQAITRVHTLAHSVIRVVLLHRMERKTTVTLRFCNINIDSNTAPLELVILNFFNYYRLTATKRVDKD